MTTRTGHMRPRWDRVAIWTSSSPRLCVAFGVFAEMQVDMPLNVVLASVFVPTEYRYGEFTV